MFDYPGLQGIWGKAVTHTGDAPGLSEVPSEYELRGPEVTSGSH